MRQRIPGQFAICIFFIVLSAVIFNAGASAQESSPAIDKQTQEISSQVLSPFCPGRTLNDCPSSAASELKQKISGMLSAGKTREQVLNEMFATYGEEMRAAPKKEGFGLLAWLIPPAFLLAGLLFFFVWIKKHNQAATHHQSDGSTIDPEVLKKIEEEVSK